jgi:hypothetical protein
MSKRKVPKPQSIEYRPIVIQKSTVDVLMTVPHKDRSNAMALYLFYYYSAIWQKTNQPRCTDSYISGKQLNRKWRTGLGWGKNKVSRIRNILIKLGLVEWVKENDGYSYIKVKYYHGKETAKIAELQAILASKEEEIRSLKKLLKKRKNPSLRNRELPKSGKPKSEKPGVNAYRDNNKTIARKVGDEEHSFFDKDSSNKFERTCSNKLLKAISNKRQINKRSNLKKWIFQFHLLRVQDRIKKQRIKTVLLWYIKNLGEEFVPAAYSAESFRDKFLRIEDAMKRDKKKSEEGIKKPKIIVRDS